MTRPDISAEDYAYPAEQQAAADAERELLTQQLTQLRTTERFTMVRNAARRAGRADRFDIVQLSNEPSAPAYVRGVRLVYDQRAMNLTQVAGDNGASIDPAFYRRSMTHDSVSAPVHVVAQGSVIKGDSSPEPTARRLVLDDAVTGEVDPARRARVAVIDTGLTAEVRGDGWLTALSRSEENRDVLDRADDTDLLLDRGAGHGTFVAGIVQQVCPTAEITVYRALDTDGVGREDQVQDVMERAVREGNEILTLSFGTSTADGQAPLALQRAVEIATEINPDVLIVAAAGNDGTSDETWPAAFKQVKAVAALTADLQPCEWSSHGSWVSCSTVGEGIVSTFVDGTEATDRGNDTFGSDAWAMWSGTSFAAPQIAGGVARLLEAHRDADWTPGQAYEALVAGASTLPGYGRIVHLLPGTQRPEGWTFPPAEPSPAISV